MKKNYKVLNEKNYILSNIVFNVLSFIMILISYRLGFFGDVDGTLYRVLVDFGVSLLEPVGLFLLLIIVFHNYKQSKSRRKKGIKTITIEFKTYSMIFIPLIVLLMGLIIYFKESPWLVAFILLFYNMLIFHYLYVWKIHKTIDEII